MEAKLWAIDPSSFHNNQMVQVRRQSAPTRCGQAGKCFINTRRHHCKAGQEGEAPFQSRRTAPWTDLGNTGTPKEWCVQFPQQGWESAVCRRDMIVERANPRGHCAIRETAVEARKSWLWERKKKRRSRHCLHRMVTLSWLKARDPWLPLLLQDYLSIILLDRAPSGTVKDPHSSSHPCPCLSAHHS